MKKLRLYLETSVWNFLFASDSPEKMHATKVFFNEINGGKYEIFISETVIKETLAAPDAKRLMLADAIAKYTPAMLDLDEDTLQLTELYISCGILSGKHYRDLLHLACASVNEMDALISWNMAHLVKLKTQTLANAANKLQGYREIQIRTPMEVIEIEDV